MQNSPFRPDSEAAPAGERCDVGIDPGLVKCGYAVVALDGRRMALDIVPTPELTARLARDIERQDVRTVCLGNATKSGMVHELIKTRWPELCVKIVDERNTSLEARLRYYEDHPPKGLWRLVPRGLLVPKAQLDGYAALLIIERYRAELGSAAVLQGGRPEGKAARPPKC
jgi:RNase H-fold protein (predicted Holliday junction resolvase)